MTRLLLTAILLPAGVLFLLTTTTTVVQSENSAPRLNFTTNLTSWTGEPFLATCDIDNFNHAGDYSVVFYRTVDSVKQEIGRHVVKEVTSEGPFHHIFVPFHHANIEVHSGPHFSLPTFDITVRYLSKSKPNPENFWCELEANSQTHQHIHQKSNIWVNTATAQMIINYDPFTLICKLDTFEGHEEHRYAVEFYRNHQQQKWELLGRYTVKPGNISTEFTAEADDVSVGSTFWYPNFNLYSERISGETLYSCILEDFGTKATDNATVINSNNARDVHFGSIK